MCGPPGEPAAERAAAFSRLLASPRTAGVPHYVSTAHGSAAVYVPRTRCSTLRRPVYCLGGVPSLTSALALFPGIEDLRDKREEINRQILKEDEEKAKARARAPQLLLLLHRVPLGRSSPASCARGADPERPGCADQAVVAPERQHLAQGGQPERVRQNDQRNRSCVPQDPGVKPDAAHRAQARDGHAHKEAAAEPVSALQWRHGQRRPGSAARGSSERRRAAHCCGRDQQRGAQYEARRHRLYTGAADARCSPYSARAHGTVNSGGGGVCEQCALGFQLYFLSTAYAA